VSKYVQEVTDKTEVPELKKIGIKHDFPDIIRAVAQYFRVGEDELLKRKRATGEQRKLAIYLSKIISGGKNVEVGKVFGITIQAVTNVVGDIERRLEEDGKLSKEVILIKNVLEKENV
jgi:chromosomal replication initiation ATPase DnaA